MSTIIPKLDLVNINDSDLEEYALDKVVQTPQGVYSTLLGGVIIIGIREAVQLSAYFGSSISVGIL